MQAIIYVRQRGETSLYEQFNICAEYCKKFGYSISGKVLDFEGNKFHEAVNKIIPRGESTALIIYSKGAAFDNTDDYLFFRIYLEKLGHKITSCN